MHLVTSTQYDKRHYNRFTTEKITRRLQQVIFIWTQTSTQTPCVHITSEQFQKSNITNYPFRIKIGLKSYSTQKTGHSTEVLSQSHTKTLKKLHLNTTNEDMQKIQDDIIIPQNTTKNKNQGQVQLPYMTSGLEMDQAYFKAPVSHSASKARCLRQRNTNIWSNKTSPASNSDHQQMSMSTDVNSQVNSSWPVNVLLNLVLKSDTAWNGAVTAVGVQCC